MYSIHIDERTGNATVVRDRDGARIPQDFRNLDYAEFLHWNSQQAEPLDVTNRTPVRPPPPRTRSVIRQAIAGMTQTQQNQLRNELVIEQLLDMSQDEPDRLQAIMNRLGLNVTIREAP